MWCAGCPTLSIKEFSIARQQLPPAALPDSGYVLYSSPFCLLFSCVHAAAVLLPLFAVAQATAATSCPARSSTFNYVTPLRATTSYPTDPNGFAEYNLLKSRGGWDVPTPRPSPSVTATPTTDFYSILCDSFNNPPNNPTISTDRKTCLNGIGATVGEVHVRYSCAPRTLWVLAFVYKGVALDSSNANGNFWAVYDCSGGCQNGGGSGTQKFLNWAASGSMNSGSCDSTCSCANCWCCLDMWPVQDNGEWVGWMGKASFDISGVNNTVSYDYFLPHIEWGAGKTGSAANGAEGGLCLDCSGPGK